MIKPLSLIAVILCGLGIALYFYEQGAEQGKENLSGQILLKQLDTKNLKAVQNQALLQPMVVTSTHPTSLMPCVQATPVINTRENSLKPKP